MPRKPSWAGPASIIMLAAWLGHASADPEAATEPFGGKPAMIPGTVEAEHFDLGGEGKAYHDLDDRNQGVAYREPTGVDIEKRSDASNGHGIGWTRREEWLMYSVEVATAGRYRLEIPVASKGPGGVFHIEFNGRDLTGPLRVPDTGGWDRLQTITKTGITLPAGPARMRVVMDADGAVPSVADIDCFRFLAEDPAVQDATSPPEPEAGNTEAGRSAATKSLRLAEGMAGPLSAAKALASMETLAGLRVELVAAEPQVADPVAIDWGSDGSLWVAEMADYPLGIDPPPGANQKGRPGGRVRRLVDTDGDGFPDSATVVLDGIPFPTGVMAWRDGVIVASAPTVFFARDTTGDGRADERIDLFTGFKEGNQQHRINGLRWGLDGWCWLANGDSGGLVRSLATGRELHLGNRDLRVRPETGEMEPVAGMSQFGRARDDWGHWFGCSNSQPCFLLGPDDPALARNRFVPAPVARHRIVDPGQRLFPTSPTVARFNYPGSANHFTSACGLEICRDPLLGADFASSLVVCEPAHNLVHREALERDGWAFRSRPLERETHLLRSSDNWFRPVMARIGPDGCLWVVDLYRAVIEHPEWIPPEVQERIDLRAGDELGRIWRLVPAGGRGRPVPRLDRLPPAELVALLSSPNGTLRDLAQRTVIERCTPPVATAPAAPQAPETTAGFQAALEQAATAGEPVTRATAIWTLALIGRLGEPALVAALADSDPRVQAQAVAVSRLDLDAAAAPSRRSQRVGMLARLAGSDAAADPDLALALACSLGSQARPEAAEGVAALVARHRGDALLSQAILAAFDSAEVPALLAALPAEAVRDGGLASRLAAMVAATGDAGLITGLVGETIGPAGSAPPAAALAAVAEVAAPLRARGTSLTEMAAAGDSKLAVADLQRVIALARAAAADPAANRPLALAGIRLVASLADADRAGGQAEDLELLATLLDASRPPEVQAAAVDALVQLAAPPVAERLLAAWRTTGPTTARMIIERLLGREAWAAAVVAAVSDGRLPPAALDAASRQRLLGHPTAAIREAAEKTLAAAASSRAEVLREYSAALTLPGDAVRGMAVFAKRCGNCHRIGDLGHEVGPNLAAVGNRSPAALLEAILDPNRVVEDRYVSYIVVTDEGRQHTGLLAGETDATLTLRGQDGRDLTLRRDSLDEVVRTGRSLMPEGLENDLSVQDLADLFSAIGGLGTPAKP
jgi:putative membrane-bound dehydrogenase-like protein